MTESGRPRQSIHKLYSLAIVLAGLIILLFVVAWPLRWLIWIGIVVVGIGIGQVVWKMVALRRGL